MRGKKAKKRSLQKDPQYGSEVVTKLINFTMKDGNKTAAQKIIYGAMEHAGDKLKKKPLEVLEQALGNIMPRIEVRSRRVGGANYQVPVTVREERQMALALRWLLASIKTGKKSKPSKIILGEELIAATKKEGAAYKKREDVEKMAEANRAFAHFQW